jgi:hypothetical protein
MVLPRMTEEVAIELLTRAHELDAEGAGGLIYSLDAAELRSVLLDMTCMAVMVLKIAGTDHGDGYGGELLRRAAVDYMAEAVAT